MKKRQAWCLIGFLALLTGCGTTTYRQPLDAAASTQMHAVQLSVTTDQQKLTSQAQNVILPLSNEMLNFDVVTVFKAQLQDQLSKTQGFKINNAAQENGALSVMTRYRLNNNFTALMMSADVKAYVTNAKNKDETTSLYRNHFTYIYYLPKSEDDRYQIVQNWMQNDNQLIKQTLRTASSSLAQWIAIDINNPNANLYANMKNAHSMHFFDEDQQELAGKLITMSNGLYIIRMSDDRVYIVNQNALKHS